MDKRKTWTKNMSHVDGDWVRAMRSKVGMTQEEFADAIGVALRSIQAYEGDEALVPRTTELAMRYVETANAFERTLYERPKRAPAHLA